MLHTHRVYDLALVELDQAVSAILGEEEPVCNRAVYLVATAAADGIVCMVFEQFFPDRFDQAVVVGDAQTVRNRGQRLENVGDFVFNAGVGRLEIRAGGVDAAVYAHVFAIEEFPV